MDWYGNNILLDEKLSFITSHIKNSINIHRKKLEPTGMSYMKLIHVCVKPGQGPADSVN